MLEPDDYVFKILVVGEPGVGKTSMTQRYVNGNFSDAYKSTIGVDFANKSVKWSNNIDVSIQLWDLAGQERLGTQVNAYFRETDGVLCIYSIIDKDSFAKTLDWKKLIDSKCTHSITKEVYSPPTILIANKTDLFDQNEVIDVDILQTHAKELGFTNSILTSAKNNIGVDDAMKELISIMIANRNEDASKGITRDREENVTCEIIHNDEEIYIRDSGRRYTSCGRC